MGLKELKQKFFPVGYSDSYNDNYIDENEDDIIEGGEEDYIGDDALYNKERTSSAIGRKSYESTVSRVGVVSSNSSSLEMKVVSPTKYEAVTQIADILLDKKTVLLNLENTNKETAKRLIDFLSGVAYALGGDIQKVADNTFAVTPNNVAVSNENVDSDFAADADDGQYE